MGQVLFTISGRVQQQATLDNLMPAGRDGAKSLLFFYPECEGQKTSSQANAREAIKSQQELNYLCRRNKAQAQMRRRKKYDKDNTTPEAIHVGAICMGVSECRTTKGDKEVAEEVGRTNYERTSRVGL